MRVFQFVYRVPDTYSVNVISDLPGFKKVQYLSASSQCTGVWLFNQVTAANLHEKYVTESIDGPMAKRFTSRTVKPQRAEGFVPVLRQDARTVRYTFEDHGTKAQSGYLELYDALKRVSVVALSDCPGENLEADQSEFAKILASRTEQDRVY
jgi:hypothetical protein